MKKLGISIAILKTGDEENPWKLSIIKVEENGGKPPTYPSHHAEWVSPATGEMLYTHNIEAASTIYLGETDGDMGAVFTSLVATLLDAEPVKKALETVINQTINNIPWLATGKPRNGK